MLKESIKKILIGTAIPQEYVCVEVNDFEDTLSVFLLGQNGQSVDVTNSHLFLGYKPLIIGLPHKPDGVIRTMERPNLSFKQAGQSVANLTLRKIGECFLSAGGISLYTGEKGSHSLIHPMHRWVNGIRERLRKHPPGNITLPGNLLDQIRIAYSIPRIISVITVGWNDKINMFPTDLHGSINDKFYVSSLRLGGKANAQVEEYKRIVISQVCSSSYKEVYELGKNHMKDLRDMNEFLIHPQKSEQFELPLPIGVQRYIELEKFDSLDFGIHRIHLYRLLGRKTLQSNSTLGHIHQYYAQWRQDKGFRTQLFLR